MELILINQSKLKIMLSAPDMRYYELLPDSLETMTCPDAHTRSAFRQIFDDVEAQTGFHTSGERLLVQMFTSKCGGCEIFVTKLEKDSLENAITYSTPIKPDTTLTKGEASLLRQLAELPASIKECEDQEGELTVNEQRNHLDKDLCRQREPSLCRITVTTTRMADLLAVCHRLIHVGYSGFSAAYMTEHQHGSTYELFLEVPDAIFYLLPEKYAFLKEYGKVSHSQYMDIFVSEHGRQICKDTAVEILGTL